MAKHHGTTGLAYSGANKVGELTGWTYDEESDIFSDWAIGDSAKTYAVGTPGGAGTIEMFYDEDDTAQGTFTIGSTITLHLALDNDAGGTLTAGDAEFTGSVIVSSRGLSLTKEGFTTQRVGFVGQLTEQDYPA
jgi:hypothetical protein